MISASQAVGGFRICFFISSESLAAIPSQSFELYMHNKKHHACIKTIMQLSKLCNGSASLNSMTVKNSGILASSVVESNSLGYFSVSFLM